MRITVVLLALVLVLLGPPALRAQSQTSQQATPEAETGLRRRLPPLEVAVQVGFDHRSRGTQPGSWAPVTLSVVNHTEKDLYGTLVVTTVNTAGTPGGGRVSRPIAIQAKQAIQVTTTVFVAPGDSRLDATITMGSGETASVTDSLLAPPRLMRSMVVLGEAKQDPRVVNPVYAHDALGKAGRDYNLTGLPLVGYPGEERGYNSSDGGRWHILQALPTHLPDRWIAYGAIDTLIVTDPLVVDQVPDAQWAAIVEWVRSGGQLFVECPTGEAAQAVHKSARLANWLPASPLASRSMSANALKRALNMGPSDEADVVCMSLAARPGAETIDVEGVTVLAHQKESLGHVALAGFSLVDSTITNDEGGLSLVANAVLNRGPATRADFERQTGAASLTRQLDYELKSEELAQIPSHRVLLAFLLGYCLCIGPINRLMFGSEKKPLRPWAILPLIVLGFVGLAMNSLAIKRPEVPLLREITVVQARAGDTDGLARSYLSLYSPHRASYRFDYPKPGTAIQYLIHNDMRGLDRDVLAYVDGVDQKHLDVEKLSPATIEAARPYRLEALPMAPRSSANLAATQRLGLGGTITFGAEAGRATVTNGLPLALDGAVYLSTSGSQHEVLALRPGATAAVESAGSAMRGLNELISRTGRDRKVLELLVHQLKQVQTRPALIGWTSSSLTSIKAKSDAGEPQQSSLTFFLIHPGKDTK